MPRMVGRQGPNATAKGSEETIGPSQGMEGVVGQCQCPQARRRRQSVAVVEFNFVPADPPCEAEMFTVSDDPNDLRLVPFFNSDAVKANCMLRHFVDIAASARADEFCSKFCKQPARPCWFERL
mmetsp:Transcript_46740/g.84368  ORF Transcript_46740/g.84368 Transcript_46740/m.84368 type:complete len:124 (-) Transcript_46740:179-550(-)